MIMPEDYPERGHLPAPQPLNALKEAIDAFAGEVAAKLNFRPGQPMSELLEKLGGTLHYQSSDEWLESEDGSIYVYGPGKFEVFLPNFTSSLRDQFTMAHELGHYALHSHFGRKPIKVARHGSNRVEWEANWFAAGFLMPKALFQKEFESSKHPAVLARHFGVSIKAAEVRIESLGLS